MSSPSGVRPASASYISIGGRALPLPVFFFSVSSVKANWPPVEFVEFLAAVAAPQFLVSAFDIARSSPTQRERIGVALEKAQKAGSAVLLDSGNYEAYWLKDQDWSPTELASVLAADHAPLAFCFDDQAPPEHSLAAADGVVRAVERDQSTSKRVSVAPIVHGSPLTLPERVRMVASRLHPPLLAVAERELGDGILARAATVRRLRQALDEVAPACELHLLGTGNPLSMLLFAICGASSFDGLEWCQTCADPASARLLHFQQRELVSPLDVPISGGLTYAQTTLLHNITFFSTWTRRVREALRDGTAQQMLMDHLPTSQLEQVEAVLRQPL